MTDLAMHQQNYPKLPNDSYFTVDPRCVQYLAKVFHLKGPFVEPCAGQGHLIKDIEAAGGELESASDLHAYDGQDPRILTGINVLGRPPVTTSTIITNPPYTIAMAVIVELLQASPEAWVVVLMRASQAHVQGMRRLMAGPRFHGIAPLPFRPKWFADGPHSPRHDFSWFLWRPTSDSPSLPRLMI